MNTAQTTTAQRGASADVCTTIATPLPPVQPGGLFFARLSRPPYAAEAHLILTDLNQSSAADIARLLSSLSSANTASTSELLGSFRMLAAMARAVRNRSYVLMEASTSEAGAPDLLIAASRTSNSSIMLFTPMGLTVFEVDTSGHATPAQGGAA